MIIPSNGFRNELFKGNRNYIISVSLYTTTGSYLITNAEVWEKTFSVEDMVSQDDTFDIGQAIINKMTLGLNNITERYSGINFKNAVAIPRIGLQVDGEPEMLQKGIYIVDDCKYDGSIIKLTCLDLMGVFDREYSTDLTFPATLAQIVADACDKCGITIDGVKYPTAPSSFTNSDYTVAEKPTRTSMSFREIIAWVAQIAGGFARVDRLGHLEIKWFNTQLLASLNEDHYDGGSFRGGESVPTVPIQYIDTTEGMTKVVDNTKNDDTRVTVTGVDWLIVGGVTCTNFYVCGNSWISPDYSGSSSSFPTSATVGWGFNCRDGAMWNLYRQEFTHEGKRWIKLRWEGYSAYSYTSSGYEQKWELFIREGGYSFIHAVQKPTSSSGGTYKIKVGSTQTTYTATTGETYGFDPSGAALTVTPYEDGDVLDGGGFMTGGATADGGSFIDVRPVNYITECFATDVAVDRTTVTGVKLTYQIKTEDSTEIKNMTAGTKDFQIEVTDNDFITTDAQATTVCSTIANNVVGMQFFRADVSHLSDPCIEAGDIALVRNFRGNLFPTIVSRTKFGVSVSQTTNSNAETDSKASSYRDFPAISISTVSISSPAIETGDFPWSGGGIGTTIPTDLIVVTAPVSGGEPGVTGEDWAIYVDEFGDLHTQKVPKRIYFYVEPQTEYYPGETVDVSNAVVHAVYNDGTEVDVTSECTFSPAQGSAIAEGVTSFSITATWVFTPGVSNGS